MKNKNQTNEYFPESSTNKSVGMKHIDIESLNAPSSKSSSTTDGGLEYWRNFYGSSTIKTGI